MSSNLGSRLKQARESRGVGLREIAATTKISVTALEALERNDFSRLPGGIFSRSFVRAYALAVGLDPEAAVGEFVLALQESERDAERNARRPVITADDRAFLAQQQRALRQLRLGAAVAILVIAAAMIWWLWSRRAAPESAQQPPAPAQTAPSTPVPATAPASPAASSPDPAPPPDAASQPLPTAPAADHLAIELDFIERCWMDIHADGIMDTRREFEAGEHHFVRATQEITMRVGNAGGVRWTINGRPARPLGRSGATRELRITIHNYAAFLE